MITDEMVERAFNAFCENDTGNLLDDMHVALEAAEAARPPERSYRDGLIDARDSASLSMMQAQSVWKGPAALEAIDRLIAAEDARLSATSPGEGK